MNKSIDFNLFYSMINFALLKKLPSEIKVLIYVAVKNYHNRKMRTGYVNIINDIKNLEDKQAYIKRFCETFRFDYTNQILMLTLEHTKLNYFNNKENMNLIDILKFERYIFNTSVNYHFGVRRIIFDCNEIRRMYGNSIYVYCYPISHRKWIRFRYPLAYRSELPIRNFNLYNSILISHLDNLYDENIDPRDITSAIENPIFKFNFNELFSQHFKFSDKNKYIYNYLFNKNIIRI